jgi:23S rRNA (uracil1939-C5)-methyltransferase
MIIINTKKNDVYSDLPVTLFKGKPYIIEQMESLKYQVGPVSFYQTNSEQAYTLYKVAREYAALTGVENVYDLYTGTGTIANFVAQDAKQVTGIEYVESAVDDAKLNSRINSIANTDFVAGDMAKVFNDEFVAKYGKPDVIITDPPRAGMHASVVEKILELAPTRIVYVSCNPATQARDLALMDEKYSIEAVQPVDMFPHTHHVENVVLLIRK